MSLSVSMLRGDGSSQIADADPDRVAERVLLSYDSSYDSARVTLS